MLNLHFCIEMFMLMRGLYCCECGQNYIFAGGYFIAFRRL